MPQETISEHNTFINLILVACEDSQVKKQLLKILQLPQVVRMSTLNTFIYNLKRQNAPQDFIEAISFLKNEKVAQQMLILLGDD